MDLTGCDDVLDHGQLVVITFDVVSLTSFSF